MGHGLSGGPLGGLIVVALVTVMLGVTVGCVLYRVELAAFVRRLAHRVSPPPEPVTAPPIERIARDAHRVRVDLLSLTPGTPMAKRLGVVRAYDDLLADACRALSVPDTLAALPPGFERDAERLHVEHELEAAGLCLTRDPRQG